MRRSTLLLLGVLIIALSGCRGDIESAKAIAAINAVNTHFQACYEETLSNNGTHAFETSTKNAMTAMGTAMRTLEMDMVELDSSLGFGYIKAVAPAPLPLIGTEWRQAQDVDLRPTRKIIAAHVGFMGNFSEFEPETVNVVLTITAIDLEDGTELSITMRFDEIEPPKRDYPRRTYPPCEAMRVGLDKIWETFRAELDTKMASQ